MVSTSLILKMNEVGQYCSRIIIFIIYSDAFINISSMRYFSIYIGIKLTQISEFQYKQNKNCKNNQNNNTYADNYISCRKIWFGLGQ